MSPAIENSAERLRIVLVDDDERVRVGMRMTFESDPGIDIVGEAADARDAVNTVVAQAPDLVVMDIRMPGASGIEATRRIKDVLPTTIVLMLTSSDDEEDVYKAIRAGASGYLLKDTDGEALIAAVRRIANGERIISPSLAGRVVRDFAPLEEKADAAAEPLLPHLTARERRVLELVAAGTPQGTVARRASLSDAEVMTSARNIFDKLHLRNRLQTVVHGGGAPDKNEARPVE